MLTVVIYDTLYWVPVLIHYVKGFLETVNALGMFIT
jgi:hypothetical protein